MIGANPGSLVILYKDLGAERHNIDGEKPELHLLARSLDGGESLFWYSYDRGHNWEGPSKLPDFSTFVSQADPVATWLTPKPWQYYSSYLQQIALPVTWHG